MGLLLKLLGKATYSLLALALASTAVQKSLCAALGEKYRCQLWAPLPTIVLGQILGPEFKTFIRVAEQS